MAAEPRVTGTAARARAALIWAPVWLVVVAVILRVGLEIAIVFFRVAQATIETARNTAPPSA